MSLPSFALFIAAIELLIGLPLLVVHKAAGAWVVRLTKDEVVYRLFGGLLLVVCLMVLVDDYSVDWSVAGVVRLLAWWAAIKAVLICWWPGHHARFAEKFLASPLLARCCGLAAVTVGVLLLWAFALLR